MKTLTLLFAIIGAFTMFPLKEAKAIDQESINTLKKQGFEVRMGELTGAGSKLSLKRLAGFIHPSGILMKKDCMAILVSKTSDQVDPKISDITKIKVENNNEISVHEFEGFFIK